jgi:hypothetical protein
LGGLLAGGRVVRATEGESRGSSATAEARLKLARTALDAVRAHVSRGRFDPGERDHVFVWSRRRMEARLDLSKSKADRIAAAQEHVEEMRAMEAVVARMIAVGEVDRLSLLDAQYRRLEAESWLEQEKAKES